MITTFLIIAIVTMGAFIMAEYGIIGASTDGNFVELLTDSLTFINTYIVNPIKSAVTVVINALHSLAEFLRRLLSLFT